jgi:hypothetical protein
MDERVERLRDAENFRRWRMRRMTFWGLLLESFAPSPPTVAEVNYYVGTFDTDGVAYAVKAQRAASRGGWQIIGGPLTPPPAPTPHK